MYFSCTCWCRYVLAPPKRDTDEIINSSHREKHYVFWISYHLHEEYEFTVFIVLPKISVYATLNQMSSVRTLWVSNGIQTLTLTQLWWCSVFLRSSRSCIYFLLTWMWCVNYIQIFWIYPCVCYEHYELQMKPLSRLVYQKNTEAAAYKHGSALSCT